MENFNLAKTTTIPFKKILRIMKEKFTKIHKIKKVKQICITGFGILIKFITLKHMSCVRNSSSD